MAEIESYAPLMAYLVRSMQSGGELANDVVAQDDRQRRRIHGRRRAGRDRQSPAVIPRPGPSIWLITGGGGFLLYLQMHETPTDLRAVLRDYARDMVLPALEVYTDGLLADRTMYDAFLAAADEGESHVS